MGLNLKSPQAATAPTLQQFLASMPGGMPSAPLPPGDVMGGFGLMMPGMAPPKQGGKAPFSSQLGQVSSGSRSIRSGPGNAFPTLSQALGRR